MLAISHQGASGMPIFKGNKYLFYKSTVQRETFSKLSYNDVRVIIVRYLEIIAIIWGRCLQLHRLFCVHQLKWQYSRWRQAAAASRTQVVWTLVHSRSQIQRFLFVYAYLYIQCYFFRLFYIKLEVFNKQHAN